MIPDTSEFTCMYLEGEGEGGDVECFSSPKINKSREQRNFHAGYFMCMVPH